SYFSTSFDYFTLDGLHAVCSSTTKTSATNIYTLPLHDALPIYPPQHRGPALRRGLRQPRRPRPGQRRRPRLPPRRHRPRRHRNPQPAAGGSRMTEQTPLEGLYARESAPQGEDGELEGAGRERPSGGQQGPRGWTQLEARAFNAVLPALRQAGEWLPLSARRAVAQAVLAVVEPELRIAAALHELASGVRDLASSVRLESSDRARGEVSTDSERCCGCG